jgi:hypothetical protein
MLRNRLNLGSIKALANSVKVDTLDLEFGRCHETSFTKAGVENEPQEELSRITRGSKLINCGAYDEMPTRERNFGKVSDSRMS